MVGGWLKLVFSKGKTILDGRLKLFTRSRSQACLNAYVWTLMSKYARVIDVTAEEERLFLPLRNSPRKERIFQGITISKISIVL